MSAALLMWNVVFSSVGLAYFVYGKKQGALIPLFCGLGLMIFPYFISGTLTLVIVGAILCALPWYWRD